MARSENESFEFWLLLEELADDEDEAEEITPPFDIT
jgi:hypothetical protein